MFSSGKIFFGQPERQNHTNGEKYHNPLQRPIAMFDTQVIDNIFSMFDKRQQDSVNKQMAYDPDQHNYPQ
jgi:hypothetical protein